MERNVIAALMVAAGLAAAPGAARAEELPSIGVSLDAGVPDGGTASLVYRPVSMLRVAAGVGHNTISPGVRGSLTFVPIPWVVSPSLAVSYGRFFEGDANAHARMVIGEPSFHSDALERFGYDFADAHVGLELGRRNATLSLQGGVTRVTGTMRNLGASRDGMSITVAEEARFEHTGLSARLGFIVYL